MIGFKKLALATAVLAVSTGAFAMEALQDDVMSNTTGQAGLTITTAPDLYINHLRYTDNDGLTVAQQAGWNSKAAGFEHAGTVDVGGITVNATSAVITLDVGTNGTGTAAATDTTALFINSQITGLNVNFNDITLDNGSVLVAGNNSKSFGGLSISNLSLPSMQMIVSPGGASGTQGITVAIGNAAPLNVSLDFAYTDDANSITLAGVAGDRGVSLNNIVTAGMQIDVVNNVGLQITTTKLTGAGLAAAVALTGGTDHTVGGMATGIQSIQLGSNASGIQLANTGSIGQVGILGLQVGAGTIAIAGH